MKRYIAILSLLLGLLASGGIAFAQKDTTGKIDADGSNANSSPNQVSNAEGPTVVYGDIGPGTTIIDVPPGGSAPVSKGTAYIPGVNGNLSATDGNASVLGGGDATAAPGSITSNGSGMALLGPDGTYNSTDVPPSDVTVGDSGPPPVYEPAPDAAPVADTSDTSGEAAPVDETAAEPAPVDETASTDAPVDDTATADTATADSTADASLDSDADNLPDTLEYQYGTDPYNIDSDGDGVADGDEINIYGTDPMNADTDGDGANDGSELFDTHTDPLVWDDFSTANTETVAQDANTEPAPVDESAG